MTQETETKQITSH